MPGTDRSARFRVAVIGKGLVGSAAARHLALLADGVALIGPDEPPVRADHHGVFGSHYDEGRIYRILDRNLVWAQLAERSIARYAEIEAQSGIPFHQEVGMLAASVEGSEQFVEGYGGIGDALGVTFDRLSAADLSRRFPYLDFGPAGRGAFEATKAGHISPRRLVAAQTAAAERHGATVIREPAHTVEPRDGGLAITTASGQTVLAERALVATGGFANVHAVLPRPLDIVVRGRTIVLAEVAGALLERLHPMPSLIVDRAAGLGDLYALPPIRYPDGRWYIKIGTGELGRQLAALDALGDWFRSLGADLDRGMLARTLVSLVPDLAAASIHTDTCVVTATASGYPYVDRVADNLFVAVGGNGKAAKSSDEIGRLGAKLTLTGAWNDDLPGDLFRAHYQGASMTVPLPDPPPSSP
jgi:sarcosine oxidase